MSPRKPNPGQLPLPFLSQQPSSEQHSSKSPTAGKPHDQLLLFPAQGDSPSPPFPLGGDPTIEQNELPPNIDPLISFDVQIDPSTWDAFKRANFILATYAHTERNNLIAKTLPIVTPLFADTATRIILNRVDRWPQDIAGNLGALGLEPIKIQKLDILYTEQACILIPKATDPEDPDDFITKGIFIFHKDNNTWHKTYIIFDYGTYSTNEIKKQKLGIEEPRLLQTIKNLLSSTTKR